LVYYIFVAVKFFRRLDWEEKCLRSEIYEGVKQSLKRGTGSTAAEVITKRTVQRMAEHPWGHWCLGDLAGMD